MSIFLIVIKFIAIAAAILIAVAVLLLLAILFVPVRYKIKGSLKEHIADGDIRLTWLFHTLRLDLKYDKEALIKGKLRLFGIPLYTFDYESKSYDKESGEE